jgi:REP element-mobilizing transposase RayT
MLVNNPKPHSRNLRLHRQMESPGAFFVTKCLEPKRKIINDHVASEICSALCFYSEKGNTLLAAFVVMLDHWHVVLATCDGKSISDRMKILDRWISKKTRPCLAVRGAEWQNNFYETRIISAKQFHYICAYVEENPVRAALVSACSDWKWSSANPAYAKFLTKPWPWPFEKDR